MALADRLRGRSVRTSDDVVRRIALHGSIVGLFALLLLPSSREAVAAAIGYESHLVSFLIGPALYAYGDRLVPGLDYFSQYSVGLGYVFSFFLGSTAKSTLINYVGFIAVSMILFYTGSFYFLRWLYGSSWWSLGVTLTIMWLQFHLDQAFADPSSYVLRYPLLLVVCWLGSGVIARTPSPHGHLALGSSIGASIFLNTETGTYLAAAFTLTSLLLRPGVRQTFRQLLEVGAASLAALLALSVLAFGPRAFGWDYLWHMAEPLVIYGGGFNAWPIQWDGQWHYLYNVLAPGIALATVGWGVTGAHGSGGGVDARRRASLVMLSLLALFMSLKYVNQSIAAVWHVNAYGFVAVAGWWVLSLSSALRWEHPGGRTGAWLARAMNAVSVAAALAGLLSVGDVRNPSRYALRAYGRYPSLLNAVFGVTGPTCPDLECLGHVASEDIDLITSRTRRTDRVAVVDGDDWVYLIEAGRAPKFTFVPSAFTFTRQQLEDSTAGIDLIFLPRESMNDFAFDATEIRNALLEDLRRDFVLDGEGHDLVAWRRRHQ